jgi:Pregnancy-associated plasma protein-A/Secretion system C-terminal sorting domain
MVVNTFGYLMLKKKIIFLLFLGINLSVLAQQKRCAATEYDSVLSRRYANWVLQRRALNDSIDVHLQQKRRTFRTAADPTVVRIPVVVHVIHDNPAGQTGGRDNTNISDEQIKAQIRILNEDYRRKPSTRGFNTDPAGADTGIEFYLANIDPDGRPTTGITRHFYRDKTNFALLSDDQLLANIVSWPTDRYLNIWTARFGNGTLLGTAQFPSVAGVNGLDKDNELLVNTDGVFIDFRVFGVGSAVVSRFYRLGRTTTHEVGHWLGLIHTWGDSNCGNDFCADTPTCEGSNNTTSCTSVFSTCNGTRTRNMIENYMDYTIDSCMNVFTKDQANRMKAVLELAPRRLSLVRYWATPLPFGDALGLKIYPNPVTTTNPDLKIEVTLTQFDNFTLEIFDLYGKQIFKNQYNNYPSWALNFSTQDVNPGSYIVKVSTRTESVTKRLVIGR